MASSMIHIAVANEINKTLKRDKTKLLIGTIAPDISKLIGESKLKSHFLDNESTDIPNIESFLKKYKDFFNDDFVLGYFIHLYTDYLWFKYFLSELVENSRIIKLDGTKVKLNGHMWQLYIYNDYSNMNIKLIEEYDLDLKIFSNEIPHIDNIIEEIPMDKLDLIVNQAGIIIANTKERKDFAFDINNVVKFISTAKELILAEIINITK